MGHLYAPGDHVNHKVAHTTLLNCIHLGRKWRRFSVCSMTRKQASSARERVEGKKRKGVKRERERIKGYGERKSEKETGWGVLDE